MGGFFDVENKNLQSSFPKSEIISYLCRPNQFFSNPDTIGNEEFGRPSTLKEKGRLNQ